MERIAFKVDAGEGCVLFLFFSNSLAQRHAGMVRRWIMKSSERAIPSPRLSKGIHKSMLMKFVSIEAVPGA
eukprot:415146-Pelagomonas_calceolata.AAC.1